MVYCVYSLESPRWGDSNENTQHTFNLKKIKAANIPIMLPDLALWLTLICSNYFCLERIFLVFYLKFHIQTQNWWSSLSFAKQIGETARCTRNRNFRSVEAFIITRCATLRDYFTLNHVFWWFFLYPILKKSLNFKPGPYLSLGFFDNCFQIHVKKLIWFQHKQICHAISFCSDDARLKIKAEHFI